MSADLLRRAAALMRERAEAARSGEWFADTTGGDADVRAAWRFGACDIAVCEGSLPEGNAANAEHIASWHPAVALAFAKVLEDAAAALEFDTGVGLTEREASSGFEAVIAAARAFLGESA